MTEATLPTPAEIVYPDSDGEPMADNTLQFDWIVSLKENLELLFAADPDVFVGGNLLWYPVRGDNTTRAAPDTMVAFGRPKGYRGSYRQWDEAGVAPQVVFEVLSPGNRAGEMTRKFEFYRRFGVEEYYVYDPDGGSLSVWLRGTPAALTPLPPGTPFVSPRLRVRFVPQADGQMEVFHPNGRPFANLIASDAERRAQELRAERAETLVDIVRMRVRQSEALAEEERVRAEEERRRADEAAALSQEERRRADAAAALSQEERRRADEAAALSQEERRRAEAEMKRAEEAIARARRLADKLRELGVEPPE